ncbi:MAG TPA: Mpo1-like protein [Burkholderiales bacterium]
MDALARQMSVYAAYHRNRWNRATHFIGVPAIVFAIFIPLHWVALGGGATLAHALAAAVLLYYVILDVAIGLATAAVVLALLEAASVAGSSGTAAGWSWFAAFFVGGWIFQLVGHVFEGRRPALVDNVLQVFVAPVFLVAEVFFMLGLKRALRERMEGPAGARAARAPGVN